MLIEKDKNILPTILLNKTKNVHSFTLIYIDFSLNKCECKLCLEKGLVKGQFNLEYFIGTVGAMVECGLKKEQKKH